MLQYKFQYFILTFKTELSFIRVNFSPFQIWFQNNNFQIAENFAKMKVYSAWKSYWPEPHTHSTEALDDSLETYEIER